ncbi:hypothetical protein [Stieleria sp. JC731]|nr:hypothetical protein [Stieleria sp. JC731]
MKDIGTSSWHWKFGPDKKSLVGEHKIDQTRPIPLSIRIVTTLFIADGKLMKMEWVSGAMDGKSHSRLVEVEVAVQEDGMTTLTYPAAEWENRFFSDFHIDFGDGKFSKSGWKGDRKIFETVDVKRTASPEE